MTTLIIPVLVGAMSLFVGIMIGSIKARPSEEEEVLRNIMRLPSYWMVYDLSQDFATGSWNLIVVSILEKDPNGTSRVVTYQEARTIPEAFEGARNKIGSKEYFEAWK